MCARRDRRTVPAWLARPASRTSTGSLPTVIVVWVATEDDKQALVLDPDSPYFTTPHFNGHPSVLIRGSRIGEIDLDELTELIQDAWLSRASRRRGETWLAQR